jgi:nucleoside 2-deoxyribosyltransferase
MNIYFACSITGGRDDECFYQIIVDSLLADGHHVPTAHLSRPDVMSLEEIVDPIEIYTRDIEWIESCHAMVAEVSTPSHGVGFEISYALSRNKPVLCLHRDGIRVSKMITGNNNPNISVQAYLQKDEIVPRIQKFLAQIDPKEG